MKTSEWVSPGHPDKIADYISEYILDRLFEYDNAVRYALEVQIKDNHISLAGEITTSGPYVDDDLREWCRDAVREIGYDKFYAMTWGDNAMNCEKLDVDIHISRQSPDISQGVDRDGWGDQGIFWGMATSNPETCHMPFDIWLARKVGLKLYDSRKCGIDIKTQVTLDKGDLSQVIVAAPCIDDSMTEWVRLASLSVCGKYANPDRPWSLIVNGTGRYVTHSSIGDCGTTGRKLAVDFYGCNCEIGGGSPWTKDSSKADLTLNAYARKKACDYIRKWPDLGAVKCHISCCIGKPDIQITILDMRNEELESYSEEATPKWLAQELGLYAPVYAELCKTGIPYMIH